MEMEILGRFDNVVDNWQVFNLFDQVFEANEVVC